MSRIRPVRTVSVRRDGRNASTLLDVGDFCDLCFRLLRYCVGAAFQRPLHDTLQAIPVGLV